VVCIRHESGTLTIKKKEGKELIEEGEEMPWNYWNLLG
jgi:hypothetical protein